MSNEVKISRADAMKLNSDLTNAINSCYSRDELPISVDAKSLEVRVKGELVVSPEI